MGAAGERPHRLAAAARRWPVARDRSPAWFGTCLEGFLCAPVARAIFLPQGVHIFLPNMIAVAGGGTNAMGVSNIVRAWRCTRFPARLQACCPVGGPATSSRRAGFGRCLPGTTSTTPRTSPFSNPRGPLVSVSSCSGRIRKLLPQLRVCVFRLVMMVRVRCNRSLGRLNLLDVLLRHNALVGGHPGPRKRQMNNPFYYSLTRRTRVYFHARQE